MSDKRRRSEPDLEQRGPVEEQDQRYAEAVSQHSSWPIGDTNAGTGTLEPTDDIGSGGPADVAGIRDFGGSSSIRTGQVGVGGVVGTRLGDVGPGTGAAGASEAERGGLDALARRPAAGGRSASASTEGGQSGHGALERREARVDTSAGGGLNEAAVGAAGLTGPTGDGARDLPGTDDLGAAKGQDLGAGLGKTRGSSRQTPRGQITGSGGTRGSGAGTGHLEDRPG